MSYPSSELLIDPLLIRKYAVNSPTYTSYPTTDRFVEAFGEDMFCFWLSSRNIGGIARPLALHIHLPFCRQLSFATTSGRRAAGDSAPALKYVDYLGREIGLTAGLLGRERQVSQIHWAGVTPSILLRDTLQAFCKLLESNFAIATDCDVSIEVDPRRYSSGAVASLRELGFNRVSFGIKADSHNEAHRIRPETLTRRAVGEARAAGFHSINCDLTYGLPQQTLVSFDHTLDRVLGLEPDRITLHKFAPRTTGLVPKSLIPKPAPPSIETQLQIRTLAIGRLMRAGYLYIGMDHFAKPADDLAVAQRQGRLLRNCQGYSTRPDCDLLGFGPSAISRVGPCYSLNAGNLKHYCAALEGAHLPVRTGLVLSKDDLVRRAVIQALLCQFRLSIESIQTAYLLDFSRYFATELDELSALEADGLVEIQPDWIVITPPGRLLVPVVCMIFDSYLREGRGWAGFPEVV
ncbi:MAG: oxygen-independent coproporphyrinogen III oxidase [Betaproteobacteria bacterium]